MKPYTDDLGWIGKLLAVAIASAMVALALVAYVSAWMWDGTGSTTDALWVALPVGLVMAVPGWALVTREHYRQQSGPRP